jgi:hypothetical protein
MDFGGFILFVLLATGLPLGGLVLAAAFFTRSAPRWRGLGVWLGGMVLLTFFGRFLYQVYWLDEKLVIAASKGDTARVEALLTAGASPNAEWEDGTSALAAARSLGRKDVVRLLKRAGAVE